MQKGLPTVGSGRGLAEGMMHAGASTQIDVDYGARTPEGVCQHNGYRPQRWVPRVGTSYR